MPRPTSSTTIQRPDLGALAYEYAMNAPMRGFIGVEILPVFETPEQSSDYPVIPIESLLKMPASIRRQARGSYARDDFDFETGTFACEEYGFEAPVDDTEARLYNRFFDAEAVATERATDILMRAHEMRVASAVFSTGNITNTGAVSLEWDVAASCTPYDDVQDAKTTLRNATGVQPNAAAMSLKVFENVMASNEIQALFQYTNPVQTSGMAARIELLRAYFGLDFLLVSGAMKDTAGKGISFSLSDIWDDEYVLLFRKPINAGNLREPSLGRTFLWTEDSPQILVTEQYRDEAIRSNIYRVRHHVDEAFIFTGAGYLLSNITQ
ncbi:MAG: major capsid protein [Marinobacterium sp.]